MYPLYHIANLQSEIPNPQSLLHALSPTTISFRRHSEPRPLALSEAEGEESIKLFRSNNQSSIID
jgi:hypothetical protein